MDSNSKSVYLRFIRQIIYLVLMTLTVVGFWKIGAIYKNLAVLENGIFELLQSITLVLVSLSFGFQAYRNKEYRPILFLMSMMALTAVIREQDAYFDALIPTIGWKWCWIFPLLGITCVIRHRHTIQLQVKTFLVSNTFHMMITAAFIMIPVAQCLGHRSFLADMLGIQANEAILVRRVLEETIELIAYLTLFLSSIESLFEFRRK